MNHNTLYICLLRFNFGCSDSLIVDGHWAAWGDVTLEGSQVHRAMSVGGGGPADTEGCYTARLLGCGSELMHFSDLCFGNFTISVPVNHL